MRVLINSIFQRVKNRLFSFTNLEKEREQYLNILDRVSPDLIHIHGTENSFSTIISKTNIPIVVSIQGNIKMRPDDFAPK
jgi:hypothetical protein